MYATAKMEPGRREVMDALPDMIGLGREERKATLLGFSGMDGEVGKGAVEGRAVLVAMSV